MERFSERIAQALKLPVHRVENTLKLLEGGATIPFISRYRKEATGGMDEVQIGEIQARNEKLGELAKRKETVLTTIEGLGKLTPELSLPNFGRELMRAGTLRNWKTSICLTSPSGRHVPKWHAKRDWNLWQRCS